MSAAAALSDDRRAAAEQIGRSITEALEADEHVIPLEAKLRETQRNAYRLLAAATPSGGVTGANPGGSSTTADGGDGRPTDRVPTGQGFGNSGQVPEALEQRDLQGLPLERAKAELNYLMSRIDSEPGARLAISWRLTRSSGTE
jgi:hypothetical protein